MSVQVSVASRHHPNPHPHRQLASGISAMRAARGYPQAPSGDLAILSAETYVDPEFPPPPSPPSTRSNNKKTKKTSSGNGSGNESTTSPRKRLKRTSPEESGGDRDGDEEEKKRSRGRPRLDIKDETAADVSCCSLYIIPSSLQSHKISPNAVLL